MKQLKPLVALALILLTCSCTKRGIDTSSFFNLKGDRYNKTEENPFIDVSEQSVSTFSIDADGASYANIRRFNFILQGFSLYKGREHCRKTGAWCDECKGWLLTR